MWAKVEQLGWIEQGLPSHRTHYRSYWGRVFMGQMTQPTMSKHWRKIGPKDWASIPSGQPHHARNQKQKHTKLTQINLCTVKWPSVTKPNPKNCKNCSYVCLWLCTASVHNTKQNSSDNLPSYHQTNIIAQMLSFGGEGAKVEQIQDSGKIEAGKKLSRGMPWAE